MVEVVLELAHVNALFLEDLFALAVFFVFEPLADVLVAVGVEHDALSVELPVLHDALVQVLVRLDEPADQLRHPVDPKPVVKDPVREDALASSSPLVTIRETPSLPGRLGRPLSFVDRPVVQSNGLFSRQIDKLLVHDFVVLGDDEDPHGFLEDLDVIGRFQGRLAFDDFRSREHPLDLLLQPGNLARLERKFGLGLLALHALDHDLGGDVAVLGQFVHDFGKLRVELLLEARADQEHLQRLEHLLAHLLEVGLYDPEELLALLVDFVANRVLALHPGNLDQALDGRVVLRDEHVLLDQPLDVLLDRPPG